MKTTPLSIALLASRAVAIETSATSTSTAASATCTADLITTLCDYPAPDIYAVASENLEGCWEYCNDNPPCDFTIWLPGNPYLGTGTCWLYPGESYDESRGSAMGCDSPYLEVYDKPACSGGTATTASGACAATASPSAIASVCGYPAPEDCDYTCAASSGAVNCLSLCAEADSCSYAVFNPRNEALSQYAAGTCWMYSNGTFDADATTECSGDPEQYVYENVCPKPSSTASSSSSLSSTSASPTESAGASETSSTGSRATSLAAEESTTVTDENSAAGFAVTKPLAIAVAMLWLALQ
ncbi:hypothetical protein BJY04DRAFT_177979 [Aspergillus karnatakaensis]|uniref:uncharacterized protein n=1 Tax=Aspergillus karnatakaensis TaxID=1810916 RepID=UPI003CCCA56B